MFKDSVKRKLIAILSADVKGYSRMMGVDQVGTYQTLTANLESIRFIISEHDGPVSSSLGNVVMAQFSSVVNAVYCAIELQEKSEAAKRRGNLNVGDFCRPINQNLHGTRSRLTVQRMKKWRQ